MLCNVAVLYKRTITVKIAFITCNSDPAIMHCLIFDGLSVVWFIYRAFTLKVYSLYGKWLPGPPNRVSPGQSAPPPVSSPVLLRDEAFMTGTFGSEKASASHHYFRFDMQLKVCIRCSSVCWLTSTICHEARGSSSPVLRVSVLSCCSSSLFSDRLHNSISFAQVLWILVLHQGGLILAGLDRWWQVMY